MSDTFQKKIEEAIRNPKNLGKMEDADAVGTVGGAGCGDMLRMWLKFREKDGKKVIDKASFQSFGCETAIAAASLATELIRGKTAEEAMQMSGADLAVDLGPLPPTKIHCTTMVEEALRTAIQSDTSQPSQEPSMAPEKATSHQSLLDNLNASNKGGEGFKVVMLPPEES
jgi:nitrogen fixation NifU-like protein